MSSSRYLLLFVAFLLLSCSSTNENSSMDGQTIEGLSHPESVAQDSDAETFYAANIGEEMAPSEKDGDGFISRLDADGTIDSLRYLPASDDDTLHAPKGTVVLDGELYTADIDRVVGFDLEEQTQIAEISLEEQGVTFLNDIAVLDAQTLLASGSNQGEIYRVDLDEETVTTLNVEVPGVNGLAYSDSDGVLYAVTFGGEQGGQLWTLGLDGEGAVSDTSSQTLVEGGQFDGIVLQSDDQILISDWGVEGVSDPTPALHQVDATDIGAMTSIELSDWQGPADFACAEGACWIPDLPASVVKIVRPNERMAQ